MTRSSHKKIESDILKRPLTTSVNSYGIVYNDAAATNTHNTRGVSITTFNGNQYCAFYDTSFQVILAKRTLDPVGPWSYNTGLSGKLIPSGSFDDNHDHIALGIDKTGIIHVSYGTHVEQLLYFTMPTSESIVGAASADSGMLGTNETEATYPRFFTDNAEELYYIFRDGSSADSDIYFYKYDTGSSAWSAAAGTSTQGLMIDGKSTTDGIYLAHPWHDERLDRFYFWFHFRDTSAASKTRDVSFVYYDIASATFHKANGEAYSMPILTSTAEVVDPVANDEGLETFTQRWGVVTDSGGNIYLLYSKNDAAGDLQGYLAKYSSGSWVISQITDNKNQLGTGDTIIIPTLLMDSVGTLYAIFKSTWNVGNIEVYESNDNGSSWSRPYSILPNGVGNSALRNMDHARWRATDELFFFVENKIGNDSDTVTTSSRSLYMYEWHPLDGAKSTPIILSNVRSNDDICLVSDGGDVVLRSVAGNVRVDAADIVDIMDPPGFSIESALGSLHLGNASTSGEFTPYILGKPSDSARSITIICAIDPADDTGTKPCFTFDARQDDGTVLATRPIAELRNNGTSVLEIGTEGSLDAIETTSAPAAVASMARIFAEDNGGGKTRLMVQFQTGSAVQIGIEV